MRGSLGAMIVCLGLMAGCVTQEAPSPDLPRVEAPLTATCSEDPCAQVILQPGAEPWVVVDPRDPDHAIGAAMARSMTTPDHAWFASIVTLDGGATWTTVRPPGGPSAPDSPFSAYNFAADAMVAIAGDGTVVLAGLLGRSVSTPGAPAGAFGAQLDLVIWRSHDGGQSYEEGAVVAEEVGSLTFVWGPFPGVGPTAVGAVPDRHALVSDPVTGALHLVWSRRAETTEGLDVWAARSHDGGATWSEPVLVVEDMYGVWVAAYDDNLVVTVREYGERTYVSLVSTDGGTSWGEPSTIGAWYDPHFEPAPVALWAEDGKVHALVARPDGEAGERIALHRSDDLGATWQFVGSALDGKPSDRRIPSLSIDPSTGWGALASYQGTSDDATELETWIVPIAAHGELQLGEPLRVSSGLSDRNSALEYFGLAAHPAGAYVLSAQRSEAGRAEIVAAHIELGQRHPF